MARERETNGNEQDNNGPSLHATVDVHIYYGVVVPKRAALLLDRLMVALQKVVDNQDRGELGSVRSFGRSSGPHLPSSDSQIVPSADEETVKMDLQRRGQSKGRVYWRCYFNAVTCFKRK
ncbi:uncharacterized protein LOC128887253 isoform X2 [Hylaeus anthracinus]|uniref:uncharacterized protein LOC128887253 isoform X2 n=1 Tax=Hylaeus anthracinus TaxID=313031 RepID=UPI0023BA234D|nr:uncharacterized protein LOC128887253 isoform X2 [Hylaeus anthracinus]